MIFVTVGTHEQQFDRLIRKIDELKREGLIEDYVWIQTGYSTFKPQYCDWRPFFEYQKMQDLVKKADIVITHGGPSSFIMPLQQGKIPVVVPRQACYKEHVNDHQVEFARAIEARYGNIIAVYDVAELGDIIKGYHQIISEKNSAIQSNNRRFNRAFEKIVEECLMGD